MEAEGSGVAPGRLGIGTHAARAIETMMITSDCRIGVKLRLTQLLLEHLLSVSPVSRKDLTSA